MVVVENECVDCKSVGLPCLGESCKKRNVKHFYCDECGEETTLYYFDGNELCQDCIMSRLGIVEGSDD